MAEWLLPEEARERLIDVAEAALDEGIAASPDRRLWAELVVNAIDAYVHGESDAR